jgi:hypothetical protein
MIGSLPLHRPPWTTRHRPPRARRLFPAGLLVLVSTGGGVAKRSNLFYVSPVTVDCCYGFV